MFIVALSVVTIVSNVGNLCKTTCLQNPGDHIFHLYCYENVKSHINPLCFDELASL